MYQPKVSTTQKHSDSQGEHIVCRGKLVLLKEDRLPKLGDLVNHGNNGCSLIKDESHLDFALSIHDDEHYIPVKSIIISETENPSIGDWVYSIRGFIGKFGEFENSYEDECYKILALPEHFSDKHLQAIVDVKIKDGDEALVKCEWRGKCEECQKAGMYNCAHFNTCGNVVDFTQIHLDQQNHITLLSVKQSLEEFAKEFADKVCPIGSPISDQWEAVRSGILAGAEWAKKNNY